MSNKFRYTAAGIFAILVGIYWYALPDNLFPADYATVVYDRSGKLLAAKIAEDEQWRFPKLDSVPEKFSTALLEFEDRRFYDHPGVDPIAIARAFHQNIKHQQIISGGSTLSMQVIRLARKNEPRNVWTKIREAILATRLELRYSKEEILNLYATHAPFGGNVIGLETASWRYFHRPAHRLTWAEAATLAVLPNAPGLIHPGKNRQLLCDKRNRLLKRLWRRGKLDSLSYELALLEAIPEQPLPLPQLSRHLLQKVPTGQLVTSLRKETQMDLEQTLEEYRRMYAEKGIQNAAALIIDNREAEVIAYVGNTASGTPHSAVDIVQSRRSSGSILKPFLYALAVEEGLITPDAILPDVPMNYNGFRPQNYHRDYSGAVSASEALAKSLNIPAAELLRRYGVEKFRRKLQELGITTVDRAADHYGLSLILGGAEVTLWDLARAYSVMAQKLNAYPETEPKLSTPSVDFAHNPTGIPLSSGTIFSIFQAMRNVQRPNEEGHWQHFFSSASLAWKTGTSFGHRDAWAIGVTPDYTVAVWIGNADGEGRPEIIGSSTAGRVLFSIISGLDRPSTWFSVPHDNLRERDICHTTGYRANILCPRTGLRLIPKKSMHTTVCPFHRRIHLDAETGLRAYRTCADQTIDSSFLVLPPKMAYYYKKNHPFYAEIPEWSESCETTNEDHPMEFIYPLVNEELSYGRGLNGKARPMVFKVVHKNPETKLFWHLDGKYIGQTDLTHEQEIVVGPGEHLVSVVDPMHQKISRKFTVVGASGKF